MQHRLRVPNNIDRHARKTECCTQANIQQNQYENTQIPTNISTMANHRDSVNEIFFINKN